MTTAINMFIKKVKSFNSVEEIFNVVKILAETKTLPEKYLPHPLQGDYKGYMECHILPDWLLI